MPKLIINDQNIQQHITDTRSLCGCLPRREPYGALAYAPAVPVDLIPWEEWPDRISDLEKQQAQVYHYWLDSKIGPLNQNPLSYCWGFSGVMGLMLERMIQGFPFVKLSPSSVCAPIVGYRNTGYYIEECLKWMVERGASSIDFVPETTTNARDFKPGWIESASQFKVDKWRDIGNDAQAQGSMLLQQKPLPVAHNWWSHAIVHVRLIDRFPKMPVNNPLRYARGFIQSWGPEYGENGYAELESYHSIADAAYSILQAKFTLAS